MNNIKTMPLVCHSQQECNKYICQTFANVKVSGIDIMESFPVIKLCDQNHDDYMSRFLAYASNESITHYNDYMSNLDAKWHASFAKS
jgi:hypothetical protein